MQQREALCGEVRAELRDAGEIPSRPIDACDKANLNRISTDSKYDWDGPGSCLGGKCGGCGGRNNDRDLTIDQIGRERRQRFAVTVRPTVCHFRVSSLDIAGLR
jgi:hypothetical protein